jgi:hypothetical protein
MVHRIRNILSRFPENEKMVGALIHESGEFEVLCQEYANTSQELEDLTRVNKTDAVVLADALQKRRMAVEEEILTRIEGYKPA